MGRSYIGEKSSGQNELFMGPALQTESDRSRMVVTGVYKTSVITPQSVYDASRVLTSSSPPFENKRKKQVLLSPYGKCLSQKQGWRSGSTYGKGIEDGHPQGSTAILLFGRPTSPRQLSDLINHFLFSMRSLQLWEWSPLSWWATTTWAKG